jgi:predicted nucleic acid-binding protein
MKIVVDANVVISALVRSSITREVLLHPYVDYYSPDFLLAEIRKHEKEISEKAGPGYGHALRLVTKKIIIIPNYFYKSYMQEAHKIIGSIDKDDEQYIALALSLDADGIWSYDAHFKMQDKMNIFTTADLLTLIKSGIL